MISVFLKKQLSTAGGFLERDASICGDQLIINHRKVQKYSSDSSDYWRVENNLSKNERTSSRETIDTINSIWGLILSTLGASLLANSYNGFEVSLLVFVMDRRAEVS